MVLISRMADAFNVIDDELKTKSNGKLNQK